jgi:NUDIX domain
MSRRIRLAARAVVIDLTTASCSCGSSSPARTLSGRRLGGGLEAGESHEDAIRHELDEEAGLDRVELAPRSGLAPTCSSSASTGTDRPSATCSCVRRASSRGRGSRGQS